MALAVCAALISRPVDADYLTLMGVSGGTSPAITPVSIAQHAVGAENSNNATSASVFPGSVIGVGHNVLLFSFACYGPNCTELDGGTTVASAAALGAGSSGWTCSPITGTKNNSGAVDLSAFECTGGAGGGPPEFAVSMSGGSPALPYYQEVYFVEVQNQTALGCAEAGNKATGTGTALSATSGSLSQSSGELVFSLGVTLAGGTLSSSQTILDTSTGGITADTSYQANSSTSAVTNSFTGSISGNWFENIFACKHS